MAQRTSHDARSGTARAPRGRLRAACALRLAALFGLFVAGCTCGASEEAAPVPVGPAVPSPPPVAERALSGVEAIAIGTLHGCGLVGGRVWCWGWPAPGGARVPTPQHLAAPVDGLQDVVEIRAGGKQTCARTRADALYCWGERFHEPGARDPQVAEWNPLDGPPSSVMPHFHERPVRVGIERVASFDVGRAHACAIDAAGVLVCWGSNANGEIGAYAQPDAPHRVAEHVASVDAGPFYTCFSLATGERRCLGAPPERARRSERALATLEDTFASIACSLDDGRLACEDVGAWAPRDFSIPQFTDVTAVALGAYHGCVVRASSSVWCWGQSLMGQLGRQGGTEQAAPIPSLLARAIGAGPFRTCALTTAGTVVCWGQNERGSAGVEGEGATVRTPTAVRAASR